MNRSILIDAVLPHRKGPSKSHPNEESSWVLPAHTCAPTLHSGLTSAREGSGNASPDCSRVIYTISHGGGRLNPTLEPTGSLLPEREVPGRSCSSESCPRTTNPLIFSWPWQRPGRCPQECPQPLRVPRAGGEHTELCPWHSVHDSWPSQVIGPVMFPSVNQASPLITVIIRYSTPAWIIKF